VNSSHALFFGLIFLCLNVGVRSAPAIGLVRRFDFLDDDIDQFSHWAGRLMMQKITEARFPYSVPPNVNYPSGLVLLGRYGEPHLTKWGCVVLIV